MREALLGSLSHRLSRHSWGKGGACSSALVTVAELSPRDELGAVTKVKISGQGSNLMTDSISMTRA